MQSESSKSNQRLLWSLGLGGFLVNADNRAIAPMLPAIAVALHCSSGSAALLVTAYSIPYGLFQLVYGPIAERIGKIRTILVALCLFSLGTIFCGIVTGYSWLLFLRVLTGMFAAGIIPTTLAQIGDSFELKERSKAIATFMSFSTSGQALGIVIGGIVAQYLSYKFLFLLLGVACVPTIIAMLGQQKRTSSVPQPTARTPLLSRYRMLFSNARSWLVYGLVLIEGTVFYGGFTFLGVYGVHALHLSYFIVGLLTATYSFGGFLGSRTVTRVLAKIGLTKMPVFGAGVMTIAFGLMWSVESVYTLTIGFVMLGLGFSYCHSTLQTFATDLLPQNRATAVSVFAFSLFLGSGLGPVGVGAIFDHYGSGAMLGSLTAAMAVFAVFCISLLERKRKKNLSQDTAITTES